MEKTGNTGGVLTEGPILGGFIRYTVPLILTGVLQLLFNAADMIVVGQFCGSTSLAAVGATGAITSLFTNFFIGFSTGAGVAVAHAEGAGEAERVRRTVHTAIPLGFLCGALITAAGLVFSMPMLRVTGTPDNVIDKSCIYIRIIFCGMIPNMLYNFGAAILRAVGDTKSPLRYLTISGVANVILNVVFVTAVKMDVGGVALATSLTQGLSAVLVLRTLARRKDACRLVLRELRIYPRELGKILTIGLPAGLESSLYAISNVIIQSSVNSFGSVVMSGCTASGNVEGFVFITASSINQAVLNYTGQNFGAKKPERLKRLLRMELLVAFVCAVGLGWLVVLFGRTLLSIYITDSPEAIEFGYLKMRIMMIPYFLYGCMGVMTNTLRGLGRSFTPMLISVLGICGVRLIWVLGIFPLEQFHSVGWLFASYPFSFTVTLTAASVTYAIVWPKIKKQLKRA